MYRACPSYKSFPFLTARESKGYLFEMKIQNLLNDLNIKYEGNPTNPEQWKRKIESGYDIKVYTNKRTVAVECKFKTTKCYPSWILNHHITRFFKCRDNEAKIVVTNNKRAYTSKCREVLKCFNIKLMNTIEFYNYIIKMSKVKATKFNINLLMFLCIILIRIKKIIFKRTIIPRTKIKLSSFSSKFRDFVSGQHKRFRKCDSFNIISTLKNKFKKKMQEVKRMFYILKSKMISDDGIHWRIVHVYYCKRKNNPKDEAQFLNQNKFEKLKLVLAPHSKKRFEEVKDDIQ